MGSNMPHPPPHQNKNKESKIRLKIMPLCKKCNTDVAKVYDCEHTDDEEYCKDCYTELHYYLTEK